MLVSTAVNKVIVLAAGKVMLKGQNKVYLRFQEYLNDRLEMNQGVCWSGLRSGRSATFMFSRRRKTEE